MKSSIIVALSVIATLAGSISGSQVCHVKGQVFTKCGSACARTCKNRHPICTRQCVPRCQCPRGTVINEATNKCVPCNQCPPKKKCPVKGQVFTECGSACPPNCTDPTPICTRQCVPRCQCPRGTVINEATNKCVPVNQCPPKKMCPVKGQVFTKCGSACPPNCTNPTPICTRQCVPRCQCPRGTVINEATNKCVPCNQCPPKKKCPVKGQVFTECGSACPPTCKNRHPICTRQCVPRCQCPRGTVINEATNKCVPCNQCPPKKKCPVKGQVFTECGSACPPTCKNRHPICTRQCVPRCQCPQGTVINEATNKCVPKRKCCRKRIHRFQWK